MNVDSLPPFNPSLLKKSDTVPTIGKENEQFTLSPPKISKAVQQLLTEVNQEIETSLKWLPSAQLVPIGKEYKGILKRINSLVSLLLLIDEVTGDELKAVEKCQNEFDAF